MLTKLGNNSPEQSDRADQLRRMITRTAAPFAVALILGFANPAYAELAADPPLPIFSKTDVDRIERNATLRELYLHDPWLTYRVLRTIDGGVVTNKDMKPEQGVAPGPAPFDEKRDPDLGEFQRIAPEAAVDLFALIKRAAKSNPSPK